MSGYDRASLYGQFDGGSKSPAMRWGAKETSETKELDNEGVLALQRKKMEEQDKLLDLLSESVDRQKDIAIGIGQQVDEHNELLDDLDREVRQTDTRLRKATDAVRKIGEKSSATCLWITICVLFLALIVVIFLAFYF
jgi:syntaxin 8